MPVCGSHARDSDLIGLRWSPSVGGRVISVLKQKRDAPGQSFHCRGGVLGTRDSGWHPAGVRKCWRAAQTPFGSMSLFIQHQDADEFGSHPPSGRREVTHSDRGHQPEI